MTPRALLTAIGATALAFAVAIGIAAESTSGIAAEESRPAAAAAAAADSLPLVAEAAGARLTAWNAPCEIAV